MIRLKFPKAPSITLVFLLLLSLFNQSVSTDQAIIDKQKGITLTSWSARELLTPDANQALSQILATGANWISLTVTQYQTNIHSTTIAPNANTPTDQALAHAVDQAHSLGLKVMLKPHVDLSADPEHWRAEIGLGFSSQQWQDWFASYREMIVHYAAFAEINRVDQLSVGTELEQSTPHAGEWRSIVGAVRSIFKGPLTYSANHSGEEFFMSWWDVLDYIGVDAYYPLSVRNSPSLAEMEMGWQQFLLALRGLYDTWRKPILFTELGYRSADGAAQAPYVWGNQSGLNLREQALAYQAFFNQVFWQPWFGGVFWWNWTPSPYDSGQCDAAYTPYDKPAEDVLRAGFGGLPRLSLPAPTPDEGHADWIFDNELQRGWKDTSWAQIQPDEIGPVSSESASNAFSDGLYLKVMADPGEGFALSVDGKPLDTRPYHWLKMVVQAATPQQSWQVELVNSNQKITRSLPIENCRFLSSGQMNPGAWDFITIPLDSLLGADKDVTSIILVNASQGPASLWIDQVMFVPAK